MTELLWDGKYRDGVRVLPDRTPCPLLTDEVADPLASTDGRATDADGWCNRLIYGDTREVLPALLPDFAGRVGLVYMDPPFASGADHNITIPLPHSELDDALPRQVARVAYRDTWGPSLDRYLHWFFETVTLLRELLADDGAIVVQCDWRADASLRLILDEVFGAGNFRNAIAWAYRSGGASRRESLARKHDTLLLYGRSPRFAIRPQIERQYLGRPFMGSRRDAAGRHYVDTLLRDVLDGELTLVRDGQLIRRNLRPVLNVSRERLGYPTQKPVGLIELLIEIASDPGDLVLDCCCGSGTTPAAATITSRRWIAADSSPLALTVTRARLLALPAARPFAVQRASIPGRDAGASRDGSGRALHISAHITSSPTSTHAVAPRTVVARAATLFRARREDGGQEHRADGDDSRQATAGGTCPAPTTDDTQPTDLPSFLSPASSAVPPSAPASSVTLSVDGLTLPARDLPAGVAPPGATSGCDWIAYWLVDWEYSGDVFRICDWSARPRGAGPPPAMLTHSYPRPGRRTIAVRAVDLLGGVTTATLDVDL